MQAWTEYPGNDTDKIRSLWSKGADWQSLQNFNWQMIQCSRGGAQFHLTWQTTTHDGRKIKRVAGGRKRHVVRPTLLLHIPCGHTKPYLKRKDRLSRSRKKRMHMVEARFTTPEKLRWWMFLLVNWWRVYLAKCWCMSLLLVCQTTIFPDSQV